MKDITVIMMTSRGDYPLLGLPEMHIFDLLVNSLNKQSFKDFELVIIDSLYDDRDASPLDDAVFPVKRVPPKQSPWLDLGMFHLANSFNTALIHVDGELVVRVDDCMELESKDHLRRLWNWYDEGYIPLQTFKYYFKGEPAVYSESFLDEVFGLGNFPEIDKRHLRHFCSVYKVGEMLRDTRLTQFKAGHQIAPHEWYYGVSSVPLRDALDVNGYDEAMDGCRGLLDVDFGSRLEMKGCPPFILDRELMLIEHVNDALSPRVIKRRVNFIDKYALYILSRDKKRYRANEHILSMEELEFISNYSDVFDVYWFDYWVKNQRTFNLKELREEYWLEA